MLGQGQRVSYAAFILCIYLGFMLEFSNGAKVMIGSKISVSDDRNAWLSSNGVFAIGFFSNLDQYSVGIHFASDSIPVSKQTVVWIAGADLTVGNRSYFELGGSGNLILYDSASGVVAWTSKTSDASVVSADLRDDGNFVLLNKEDDIVWQSFDSPSDTLLPGQNFSVTHILRPPSHKPLSSFYSLYMDMFGHLLLRWETSVIYWTSVHHSLSANRAMLSTNGLLQILDRQSKAVWSIFGEDHNDSNVKFRFLRLDTDGNLRLYSWKDDSRTWKSVWQAVNNQCDVFATCGLRGICAFNKTGSSFCTCPFRSASETISKCLAPTGKNCESGSSLVQYEHTNLYGIYPPTETIIHTSLQACTMMCHEDPDCSAITFINDGSAQCRLIKTSYISGKFDPSLGSMSFAKTCSDPIAVLPVSPNSTLKDDGKSVQKSSRKICIPCIVGVVSGIVALFTVAQLALALYCLRRKYTRKKSAHHSYADPNAGGCVMFSHSEIIELTENFKHQIGPRMFRGVLRGHQQVAVKELSVRIENRKFRRAVLKISSIHHKNLVRLVGYCCDSGHKLLVYEFAKNGSLVNCLADPKICKKLTWRRRINICLAVAKAISYLHSGCREFVSHGNLKCENVLLDENLEAKVSEYGLHTSLSETSEVESTAETDANSFGKILVKMITGCENADNDTRESVYGKWTAAQTESIADKQMQGHAPSDELERSLRIAFWCLQVDGRLRPSMGEVVKVLEGTLAVDPPPPLYQNNPVMPSSSSSEEESESNEQP